MNFVAPYGNPAREFLLQVLFDGRYPIRFRYARKDILLHFHEWFVLGCPLDTVFFRRPSWAGRFFCARFSLPGLPYGICRLFARLTETFQPCISVRADLYDIPVDLILSIAPLICFRIPKRQRLQALLAQLRRDLRAYRLQPLCGSTGILPIEYRKLARRI